MNRIKSNTVTFVDDELIYFSNDKEMYLKYKGDFKLITNGINTTMEETVLSLRIWEIQYEF